MAKFIKNPKILIFIILLSIVSVSFFSYAQTPTPSKLLVDWPQSPAGNKLDENSKLPDLIRYLYEWGIGLAGLFLFISLLIAGFQYLTSAGEPVKISEARDRIKSAGIGLVLLLASWLILNTINPDLTTFKVEDFSETLGDYFRQCESDAACQKGEVCRRISIGDKIVSYCVPTYDVGEQKNCEKLVLAWSQTKAETTLFSNVWMLIFWKIYDAFHDSDVQPVEKPEGNLYDAILAMPYHKEAKAEDPCENIGVGAYVPHNAYIYSAALPESCYGQLLLYKEQKCKDLLVSYPVNNWAATIDTEVRSFRLYVGEAPSPATTTANEVGEGSGGGSSGAF